MADAEREVCLPPAAGYRMHIATAYTTSILFCCQRWWKISREGDPHNLDINVSFAEWLGFELCQLLGSPYSTNWLISRVSYLFLLKITPFLMGKDLEAFESVWVRHVDLGFVLDKNCRLRLCRVQLRPRELRDVEK